MVWIFLGIVFLVSLAWQAAVAPPPSVQAQPTLGELLSQRALRIRHAPSESAVRTAYSWYGMDLENFCLGYTLAERNDAERFGKVLMFDWFCTQAIGQDALGNSYKCVQALRGALGFAPTARDKGVIERALTSLETGQPFNEGKLHLGKR